MGVARLRKLGIGSIAAGLAVAFGLAASPTMALAGPFDILKSLPIPSNLPSMPAAAPKPAAPTPTTSAAPGAMMVTASTQQAPLHKLGTDAVAVVETATPGAPVQMMDYVFAKQQIKLPAKGKVSLSYLSGCLTETFTGGTITVGLKDATVAGGVRAQALRPGCKPPTPIVLASASEAGATVNRVTPFTGVDWDERTLKAGAPVFKWDKTKFAGVTTIRIRDMEKGGEVVWEAPVTKDWIAYPPAAAKLVVGDPYKAEAVAGGNVVASALFSIDPALDVNDSMASRVVPLSAS
ncbi:hypothetical protein [Phenylobacterium sp.]|jgi:hypothetical protein|uniref:hypothetical protein n=1 Tax=Phenylobacterium sp. TaxID=1871053 RepID=UPI002F3E4C3B